MIDINSESLLSPRQAARHPAFAGPDGRPPHIASVYRLIQSGKANVVGERVHLETVRTIRGVRTSEEAIDRFIAAINARPVPQNPAAKPGRAKSELAAAGWAG